MGGGSAPRSLSRADIRRLSGCRLPDAVLHGKRSFRPRSRAVQRLSAAGFRVRLFSSLRPMVAPPACKPGQDTSASHMPRLHLLARGRPPLLAVRWPRATGLASYLSGRLSLTGQRFGLCQIAGVRKVFTKPAELACPSRCGCSFCPLVGGFHWAASNRFESARAIRSVLIRSSNQVPAR